MISIPKVVGVLSCGVLLCLGLSQATHAANEEGARRFEQAKVITGDLVRIGYGEYFVKGQDGKEVRLTIDKTTQMMGQIKQGDRVEARVDEQNHALSIRQTE